MIRKATLMAAGAAIMMSGFIAAEANAWDENLSKFTQPNATRAQVAALCAKHGGASEGMHDSGPYACYGTTSYIVCNSIGKCGGGRYSKGRPSRFVGLFAIDYDHDRMQYAQGWAQ